LRQLPYRRLPVLECRRQRPIDGDERPRGGPRPARPTRRMTMPRMSALALVVLCHVVFGATATAQEPKKKRPNIVFLLADDLRWNVLGCTGDKLARTPNLDALARKGVLFRNHFVTTSICAVSRASILSGQYARRHKINDFVTDFTPAAYALTYPM